MAGAGAGARAAERALALSYAPADRRVALRALFALDDRLGVITRAARDPTIGLMRLTWWGDALARLDQAPAPAEPLLRALAAVVLPLGVTGVELESMADGWSRHLEAEPVNLSAYDGERGGTLFIAAATVLGVADRRAFALGQGWSLVELAQEMPALAGKARASARDRLAGCYRQPWPRALRPLGALGLLARFDAAGPTRPGDARRVARLLFHRVTGR